jgi:hypothetical protein
VFDVQTALQTPNVDPGLLQVDLIAPQPDCLGDPKAMTEHEKDKQIVPLPVPAAAGC